MWFFNGFFTGRRSPKFTSRDRFMFDAGRSYEAELRGDKGTPWSEVKAQLFPDSPASSPEPAQGGSACVGSADRDPANCISQGCIEGKAALLKEVVDWSPHESWIRKRYAALTSPSTIAQKEMVQ